jgi:hypothetical protein
MDRDEGGLPISAGTPLPSRTPDASSFGDVLRNREDVGPLGGLRNVFHSGLWGSYNGTPALPGSMPAIAIAIRSFLLPNL